MPRRVTATETARRIARAVATGRVRFTAHAWDRMQDAGVSDSDVLDVLERGNVYRSRSAQGRWAVQHLDVLVIVDFEPDGTVVVTVFRV